MARTASRPPEPIYPVGSNQELAIPQSYTLRASASSTGDGGTGSNVTMSNVNWPAFYLDVTAISSNTLSVYLQTGDTVSEKYFDIITFSAVSSAGSERALYTVNSNAAVLPDEVARVTWSQAATDSVTWGLSAYGKP